MPVDSNSSQTLVDLLTQGRGIPTGATAIGAAKWYDDPRLQHVPYIQDIGALISGAHKQIPPTEGVAPVEGIADPIANIAGMLAPVAKAYVSRQVAPTGKSPIFSVAEQRGSTGGTPGDESTLDALKRMFMQRGGVESGQGKVVRSKASSAKEMLENVDKLEAVRANKLTYLDAKAAVGRETGSGYFLTRIQSDFPNAADAVKYMQEPHIKPFLSLTDKLYKTGTSDTKQLLTYLQKNVSETIESIPKAVERGYLLPQDKGVYTLSRVSTFMSTSNFVHKLKGQ